MSSDVIRALWARDWVAANAPGVRAATTATHVVVVHGEWPGPSPGAEPTALVRDPGDPIARTTIVAFGLDGDPPHDPTGDGAVRRVGVTSSELAASREGFASQGVWPGRGFGAPYRPDDYRTYCHVNRRLAAAVCATVRGPTWVFVEDHHLALVPQMVRQACARDVLLIVRWSVPWPASSEIDRRPWGLAILEGVLGADVVLMATGRDRANFLDSARDCCGAVPDEAQGALDHDGRRLAVLVDRPLVDRAETPRLPLGASGP